MVLGLVARPQFRIEIHAGSEIRPGIRNREILFSRLSNGAFLNIQNHFQVILSVDIFEGIVEVFQIGSELLLERFVRDGVDCFIQLI